MDEQNKVIIYTASDGQTKIDVKLEDETLWLTQAQMCELYQTSRTNVVEHIKHIYEEGEFPTGSGGRRQKSRARNDFLQFRYDNCSRLSCPLHHCDPVPPMGNSAVKGVYGKGLYA